MLTEVIMATTIQVLTMVIQTGITTWDQIMEMLMEVSMKDKRMEILMETIIKEVEMETSMD